MRTCLVVCATNKATACHIAAEIANTLRLRGADVDLECSKDVADVDGYDAVIVGSSLRHGRLPPAARRFLKRHRQMLQAKEVAVFALGPGAAGQGGYNRLWNRTIRFLTRLSWLDPVRIEVFPVAPTTKSYPCAAVADGSTVARWCKNLDASMHLSDWDVPYGNGTL